jgi:hypothetical protein
MGLGRGRCRPGLESRIHSWGGKGALKLWRREMGKGTSSWSGTDLLPAFQYAKQQRQQWQIEAQRLLIRTLQCCQTFKLKAVGGAEAALLQNRFPRYSQNLNTGLGDCRGGLAAQ